MIHFEWYKIILKNLRRLAFEYSESRFIFYTSPLDRKYDKWRPLNNLTYSYPSWHGGLHPGLA